MYLSVILVIIKLSVCVADTHSWGGQVDYNTHRLYERELINDANSVPKDYVIIYKYYGAHYKPVAYIEINVNTQSSGYIRMRRGMQDAYFGEREDRQIFHGRVEIRDALNVTATLTIYGMGMLYMPSMGLRKLESTKSLTFIHVKDARKNGIAKPFTRNAIGTRREGDELLYFESRNVANNSNFPSRAFDYVGHDEYITYVGFSFNSPTAMVMVNTTFVSEQEFNAVVYDLNREHFHAKMSVYGIKSSRRPYRFVGVI
ncbi:hypothetical protein Bhyg_00920 [Pseudolycoriella hygida]|uniref:Uncharacterized protein n=1 Tax=Pseudolycoriella hygida TaxID=35572 RepID=A0A9Q0S514_9DIPT|nr:hypothetical protein Bhyg_00920 [Pseudolycoriella hygida]